METQFSNREITSMFENVNNMVANVSGNLDEHITNSKQAHKDIMSAVEVGFSKTNDRQDVANGRTRKAEIAIAVAQGGLAVVCIICIPLIGWALYELVHIDQRITESVQAALSAYEIPN